MSGRPRERQIDFFFIFFVTAALPVRDSQGCYIWCVFVPKKGCFFYMAVTFFSSNPAERNVEHSWVRGGLQGEGDTSSFKSRAPHTNTEPRRHYCCYSPFCSEQCFHLSRGRWCMFISSPVGVVWMPRPVSNPTYARCGIYFLIILIVIFVLRVFHL